MSIDEVLSIPAGDSYDFIKKYHIHACPAHYNYRDSEYITFRSYDNGIMEDIYYLSKTKIIHLDPFDQKNLEKILRKNYPDCLKYLPYLSGYIKERHEKWGFSQTIFKFYILVDAHKTSLPNKPRLEKNIQGHTYFDLEDLISGQKIVVIKSKKQTNNNNSNLNKAINDNVNKYKDLEVNITNIKDEKEVEDDFLDPVKSLTEGGVKVVTIKKYERNPLLRARALILHGYTCVVCDFNFKDFYGDLGEGFIEVHHIVPISEIQIKVSVNPQKDLTVLCANCHRMIHRKKGLTLTVEELKRKLTIV